MDSGTRTEPQAHFWRPFIVYVNQGQHGHLTAHISAADAAAAVRGVLKQRTVEALEHIIDVRVCEVEAMPKSEVRWPT